MTTYSVVVEIYQDGTLINCTVYDQETISGDDLRDLLEIQQEGWSRNKKGTVVATIKGIYKND